jgi:hypothetical protein
VNVRVAAMLRYIALVGLEAASVEVGAHSHSPPARPAVDNIEGSRFAIIGFEYLTYRSPESSAEERVNIRITDVHPE